MIFPVSVDDTSVSNLAADHDEAIARVATLRTEDEASGEINPIVHNQLNCLLTNH